VTHVNSVTARVATEPVAAIGRLHLELSRANGHVAAVSKQVVIAAILLGVAICYFVSLTPGHVFVNDDFAAYVMHAKNLVEGHLYSDIRYIPNPDAMWLSPASGYPPVYPMLLAPVYRLFGLDLRAFKIATVLCFVGFLVFYVKLVRDEIGFVCCAILMLLLGFNPVFWNQREFILSEFPYLLFSFGALLVIERVYARLQRDRLEIGRAVLVSGLLYCAYGTRTIGIALVFAVIAMDLAKFRRPSRFLLCALLLTGLLVGAQTLLLTSPNGYLRAFHFSWGTISGNTIYYGKTLSYVWQNGACKGVQIVFAVIFTVAAAWGFLGDLWRKQGATEFYLLGYLAVLLAWNSEIGLRGLLPILPLYFFYGLRESIRFFDEARLPVRVIAMAAFVGIVAVSYAGEIGYERSMPAEPNVGDAASARMFDFVRQHTSPEDLVVFPKPRTIALFTERKVTALSPEQSPAKALAFLRAIHATVFVESEWSATKIADETAIRGAQTIFHNDGYRIYRLNLQLASNLN